MIPSLINRAYILDLMEDLSLLRWLAERSCRPYLVDWDRPGPDERRFTLTDYIAGRLEGALDCVLSETGQRPFLLGYCMGGLLALGLAQRRHRDIAGLVLLATPWDFHAENAIQAKLVASNVAALDPLLEVFGELPVDVIQALFANLDPQLVPRKFMAFSKLDPSVARARAFVAVEDWLNDGVPLAAAVARECLGGWYGENSPAKGRWLVAGQPVDPASITLPSLCLIPGQDRIVPPGSASALASALASADSLRPKIGHIGMMVSAQARRQVWKPLLIWLKEHKKRAQ